MARRLRTLLLMPVLATTPVRPLVLPGSDLFRVADGKFVEHWNTVDFTALEPFGIARP